MNYRSFENLNRSIIENMHLLPEDIQLIVGVPRSGLLAANILSLHMHLPLTDTESFLNGNILSSGRRLSHGKESIADYRNILVLDDSLASGKAIQAVREKIDAVFPEKNILYSVVYINPGKEGDVDFSFESCPQPRIFEWNMMNHPCISNACVDIDGVLCKDPTAAENDDGPRYLEFLKNAAPHLRCRKEIGHLVTNRLEKYREQTEEWLRKNNIRYNELIMRDLPSQQARREANDYGKYKGGIYKNIPGSRIFIESSYSQAKEIAIHSGKPVFCVDKRTMVRPGALPLGKRKAKNLLRKGLRFLQLSDH